MEDVGRTDKQTVKYVETKVNWCKMAAWRFFSPYLITVITPNRGSFGVYGAKIGYPRPKCLALVRDVILTLGIILRRTKCYKDYTETTNALQSRTN